MTRLEYGEKESGVKWGQRGRDQLTWVLAEYGNEHGSLFSKGKGKQMESFWQASSSLIWFLVLNSILK